MPERRAERAAEKSEEIEIVIIKIQETRRKNGTYTHTRTHLYRHTIIHRVRKKERERGGRE